MRESSCEALASQQTLADSKAVSLARVSVSFSLVAAVKSWTLKLVLTVCFGLADVLVLTYQSTQLVKHLAKNSFLAVSDIHQRSVSALLANFILLVVLVFQKNVTLITKVFDCIGD